ncbi:hypothetical protein F180042I2_09160 [Enterocloster bolteae]
MFDFCVGSTAIFAVNQSSGAPELRANLARGSAGFGAVPNKRDFSGFGGSRNVENSHVYRHLHRLPFLSRIRDKKSYPDF